MIDNGCTLTDNDEITEHIFKNIKNQFNSKPWEKLNNSKFLKKLPKLSDQFKAIGDQITHQEVQKLLGKQNACHLRNGMDFQMSFTNGFIWNYVTLF